MFISKDFTIEERYNLVKHMVKIKISHLMRFVMAEDKIELIWNLKNTLTYKQFRFMVDNVNCTNINNIVIKNNKLKQFNNLYLETLILELDGKSIDNFMNNNDLEKKKNV